MPDPRQRVSTNLNLPPQQPSIVVLAASVLGILGIFVLFHFPFGGLVLILMSLVMWFTANARAMRGRIDLLEHRQSELELRIRRLVQDRSEGELGAAGEQASASILAERTETATGGQPQIAAAIPSVPPPIIASVAKAGTDPLGTAIDEEGTPPGRQPGARSLALDWEQFTGAKLLSWIGGFVLFLGVAFFIKYSFEHNWVPPELRAALGFIVGAGLLGAGVLTRQRNYLVTAHTFCATGIVILYAVTFACRSVYHFAWFGGVTTFLVMVLITVTAFLLAVRMGALVVAILGLVGGFLTPALLSTGEDNPLGLFTYIALLDAGLMAVAFRRRWHFLVAMAAVGTVLVQLGWVFQFFEAGKVLVALAVFLGFNLLFLLGLGIAEKRQQSNAWFAASALALPLVTLLFTFYLIGFNSLGSRPGVIFSFALGADLCVLGVALLRRSFRRAHEIAGGLLFLALASWTALHLRPELLGQALILYLLFALAHGLLPSFLNWIKPGMADPSWSHLFAPLALLLVFIPLLKTTEMSLVIWPAVLCINIVAVGLAILSASVLAVAGVLVLTLALTAAWILRIPAELAELPSLLAIIGGFALFFFVTSLWLGRIVLGQPGDERETEPSFSAELTKLFGDKILGSAGATPLPAMSVILPFLLLIMVVAWMPLANPSPVFGLALLLTTLTLGLAILSGAGILGLASLASVLGLEASWHQTHFRVDSPWIPLAWYLGFCLIHLLFPFANRRRSPEDVLSWTTAALAGPLHFFLVYRVVTLAFPNAYMGLLPAAFAMPMLLALAYIVRNEPATAPGRMSRLAWAGGSALFFVALIFPVQFERQWLTVGWALLGVGLLWLFHRVPHPGLRATGVVLLALAFGRLALNPAVLTYYPRGSVPLLNWYLYTYGLVAGCLMLGARLLAPPRHMVLNTNTPPLLYTLGTVLLFLLVNIQIADYFAEGEFLTLQFSGNFARDMTYSIAWALFALLLLVVGIWKRLLTARWAAIGLLAATLIKLFFHDLNRLDQLHRIGAFLAVAVILIVASFLYQRFVSSETPPAPQMPNAK